MPRKPKEEKIQEYDNEDILVDGKFYQGNENILRKDATFKWTEEMLAEVKLCAKSVLHFAEKHFFIITEDGKKRIELYKYQKKLLKAFKSNRFNVVLSSRQSGKALALNTPIPTPNGYVTMGELKDGDQIFGSDGKIYNITKAHEILENRECYKITFDNGESIVADGDHLWFTQTKIDRKRKYNREGSVKTTKEILNTLSYSSDKEPNHRIPMCLNGVDFEEKSLPISPYILGLWLGDGATDGSRITVGKRDIKDTVDILENNQEFKIIKVHEDKRGVFAINLTNEDKTNSLHAKLRSNVLLGNKHIPAIYLLSSREQRLELLKGLMDSDGYITPKGHAYFYNTNLRLVKQVQSLITSLGYKAFYKEKIAKINGVECGLVGSVYFKPREFVVKLPFKLDRLKENLSNISESNRNQYHYIKNIEKVESVPVRCITVDSPDSLYLCGKTFIPTHNTTTITIYALWLVCFQSDKRVTIVANKESTAKEIFARIKMAYEQLPVYLKPHIKSWRKDGLNLGNDSSITISTTSSSGPRGTTSNLLIIDEMAHCPDDLMKELWKSALPIISSMKKSQVVVISTPNGVGNKFHELYLESQKENSEWNLEVVNWWDVPGRDEEWKEKEIRRMGSREDFDQEYACVFHEPGKTVVDSDYLKELLLNCIDPVLVNDDGSYRIYKLPNPSSFYVIGVDVGEGIGRSNTVAQILDVSNLQSIEQVAVYATNGMSPYHFGTKLLSVLNDWGRPPILIENNNNGQQVLDVLCQTHNYENVVSYHFEGFSKHYNNTHRFGIHNHTNTKYKGITNFRYWVDSLKAVKFHDKDSVLEIGNFIRLPNFTFTKKNEKDLDDRVFAMIWALFILDPNLVSRYFIVKELDEQGRPMSLLPFSDNTDLLKASPLLIGGKSTINKKTVGAVPYTHIGGADFMQGFDLYAEDRANLAGWLNAMEKDMLKAPIEEDNTGKSSMDTFFNPTILF